MPASFVIGIWKAHGQMVLSVRISDIVHMGIGSHDHDHDERDHRGGRTDDLYRLHDGGLYSEQDQHRGDDADRHEKQLQIIQRGPVHDVQSDDRAAVPFADSAVRHPGTVCIYFGIEDNAEDCVQDDRENTDQHRILLLFSGKRQELLFVLDLMGQELSVFEKRKIRDRRGRVLRLFKGVDINDL